jgi:hypothetical protein
VNFVVICESYLVFVEKSLIFLRGFDPHFTVCLGFSALRSEHFFSSAPALGFRNPVSGSIRGVCLVL